MTKITVNKRSANLTVRMVGGVLTPSATGTVTLKNQGAIIGSGTRLDGLVDVVEGTPANNETLVYNSEDDKYYVKELDLDGGTF